MINIYLGSVVLTNVDFRNTEASEYSVPYGTFPSDTSGSDIGLDDRIYSVPGIITATKLDNFCWRPCDARASFNKDMPAPSGSFIWNGGTVYGHNIDMNPGVGVKAGGTEYERFSPFLNLSRLDNVSIDGLNIEHCFMFETREATPSLFTI